MAAIGSVFLGDIQQRLRLLSPTTSTPPSSPGHQLHDNSSSPSTMTAILATSSSAEKVAVVPTPPPPPPLVDPALSLELRLRWLEAILLGVRQDAKSRRGKEKAYELKNGETLSKVADDIQRKLNTVVEESDGLKRFMEHYDRHARLLTPSFALSGTISGSAAAGAFHPSVPPPTYEEMSSSELEALLSEMEPDIRAADRDMREIEALEGKGVTGSGKLPDYEPLQPRLEALIRAHKEDLVLAGSLERRITAVVERHAVQVDALSELFIAWNDTITEAEDKLARLEREKEERKRLGME